MRSHPRGRRREELLDTLMAAAPAGRRRPGLLGLGISLLAAAPARPAEQPAAAATPPERLGES